MANKKTRIILVTGQKWNTPLEDKIKQAADADKDIELRIVEAFKMLSWDYENDRVDMLLFSPRAHFRKKKICEKAEPLGIIVQDIDTAAFSMTDGEEILGRIMEALKQTDK